MTRERWREAWEIYQAVYEMPEEQRAAYVKSASAEPETAQLVEELLGDPDPEPDAADAPDEWPQLGREIGRFRVEAPLGRGGMGEVYAARDTELDRTVALKFLSTASVGSTGHVNRFIREARAASALNHPGIVTVHDVVRSGAGLAIVMELVEGRPLRELCGEPRSPAEVAAWGGQIARALSVAHRNGIVHRDIKPENLMLRSDGYIKILDFGLAHNMEGNSSASLPAAGTLRYMAPEQARGVQASPAGDIFSLGVVLYELVAGAHPFAAPSAIETAHGIQRQQPANPSRRNTARPQELDHVILAMLAKEPAERPDAAGVAERLQAIEQPGAAKRGGRRVRKRVLWAAAGVSIAVAAGASWRWAEGRRGDSSVQPAALPFLPPAPLPAPGGNQGQPAFSPDGRSVAYTCDRGETGGRRAIAVQEVGGAPALVTDSPADDSSPAWSPDGTRIAFLRWQGGSVDVMVADPRTRAARRIGTIGSEQPSNQRLIAWTPDGSALVVADNPPGKRENLHLYRMDLAGGGKTELTAPPDGRSDVAPQFSPDGRRLALLRAQHGSAHELLELDTAGPANQTPRLLVSSEAPIHSFAWTRDSDRLLFGSGAEIPVDLWEVGANGGPPHRAPFTLFSPARQIAIAPRGHWLAYVRPMTDSNIWLIEKGRAQRWIASPQEDSDPRYSPDGSRIAFASARTEMSEIWVCGRDGGNPRQLTFQRSVSGSPVWSPDGRQIAFQSNYGGQWAVWTVAADGGQPRRLLEENADGMRPTWSPDGTTIYFSSNRTGRAEIWRTSFNGWTRQFTSNGGYEAYEGPDGYVYFTKGLNTPGIWRIPTGRGPEERVAALDEMPGNRYWEMAAGGIYFAVAKPRPGVKFFDFQTGRVSLVAEVKERPQTATNPILVPRGLTVAPGGKSFLYVQYDSVRMNVVLADMAGQ
jgi:Tol biopolymer transport system component